MRIVDVQAYAIRAPNPAREAYWGRRAWVLGHEAGGRGGAPATAFGEYPPRWRMRALYSEHFETTVVKVTTDQGVVGWGEGKAPVAPEATREIVHHVLRPVLLGADPTNVEVLWERMYSLMRMRGHTTGFLLEAISGVDIALWDILGKVTGLPVCQLLGGCYRDKVLMYASIGGGDEKTPDQMVRDVERFLKLGFKAVKIRMHWWANRLDANPEKDYQMFKAVRKLVGEGFPLSFDVNNGYSVPTAIMQGKRFQELGIYHYEEPVPQYDYAGIAQVADALEVPVSAGEQEYTRWQFRDLITQARVDIVQPDVVKCNGITEIKKIAVLAETYNKHFVPHQTQPTIGTAANLHVVASIQSATRPQEFTGQRPELDALFKEPLVLQDGYIHVPQKPGLGLELIQSKLEELAL